MTMTEFSLNNRKVTLLIICLLTILGMQAFISIPQAYDPGFTIRAAQIVTQFPGASPKRVEELVTDPLEKAILELPELDFVKSQSRSGVSIITANIKDSYSEMQPIWDKLRRKVDKAAITLPEGVLTPVINDEFGDVFGIVLAITGEGFNYRDLKQVAEDFRSRIILLEDVAKVELFGVQQEQIKLYFDTNELATYGLTPSQLSDILSQQNIVISGGSIPFGQERLSVEPSGNYNNIDDIKNTFITLPNSNETVRLDDLVQIEVGYETPVNKPISFNGVPAINVAIAMKVNGNNVLLGEQVDKYINDFYLKSPIGLDVHKVNNSPAEVKEKVEQFSSSLMQSIIVVAVIMFAFLGWRTGLVVSLLIPVSMLITLLIMANIGVGLDQISLAALIIALGMLVDNGIVMSESILVRINEGANKIEAALLSANELKLPLLTSSLTTSAAFLPIYLADSTMGEYTGALFVVVTLTLMTSWILSLVMLPLLCVLFLKSNTKRAKHKELAPWYPQILTFLVRYKWLTLLAMLLLMLISFQGLKLLPNIFFPPGERNFFKMEVILPAGTSIEHNQKVVADIEEQLRTLKGELSGIKNWVVYLGNGGPRYILPHTPRTASPEYSFWVINTHDYSENLQLMNHLESYINLNHPDAIATARLIENGAAILNPVEIRLNGLDAERVLAISTQLKLQLSNTHGLKDVSDDWGQKTKKLNIIIDQQKARLANVTNQEIALSLQTALEGKSLTEFRDGDLIIPLLLTSSEQALIDVERIMALPIYSSSGQVSLSHIARVDLEWQNANIYHRNRYKTVTVGAQLEQGFTAKEGIDAIIPWLESESKNWPNSYFYEIGGELETSKKSMDTVMDNLPIALFIIACLLVGQFNSFRKPIIILSTIPIAFIGVIAGLIIGQSFFGFMTFLGVISLAGIVINNAIVLLEQVAAEKKLGKATLPALIDAGKRRMKPIMLTTATTVAGMIPLLINGGSMWQTMAIAIIAGLIFCTIVTLIFIPVLYCIFYRVTV